MPSFIDITSAEDAAIGWVVGAGIRASVMIGDAADNIVITSHSRDFDDISVVIVEDDGLTGNNAVGVEGRTITVSFRDIDDATNGATLANIRAAIMGDTAAAALVRVSAVGGTGADGTVLQDAGTHALTGNWNGFFSMAGTLFNAFDTLKNIELDGSPKYLVFRKIGDGPTDDLRDDIWTAVIENSTPVPVLGETYFFFIRPSGIIGALDNAAASMQTNPTSDAIVTDQQEDDLVQVEADTSVTADITLTGVSVQDPRAPVLQFKTAEELREAGVLDGAEKAPGEYYEVRIRVTGVDEDGTAGAESFKTIWIVQTGLYLTTAEGGEHRFYSGDSGQEQSGDNIGRPTDDGDGLLSETADGSSTAVLVGTLGMEGMSGLGFEIVGGSYQDDFDIRVTADGDWQLLYVGDGTDNEGNPLDFDQAFADRRQLDIKSASAR